MAIRPTMVTIDSLASVPSCISSIKLVRPSIEFHKDYACTQSYMCVCVCVCVSNDLAISDLNQILFID